MPTVLQRGGEDVAFLSLLDALPYVAHQEERGDVDESPNILEIVGAAFGDDLKNESPSIPAIYDRLRRDGRLAPCFTEHHLVALVENYKSAGNLTRGFVPNVYNGNVLLFVATAGKCGVDMAFEAWKPYINGDIRIHPIACDHLEMTNAKPLGEIGPLLA